MLESHDSLQYLAASRDRERELRSWCWGPASRRVGSHRSLQKWGRINSPLLLTALAVNPSEVPRETATWGLNVSCWIYKTRRRSGTRPFHAASETSLIVRRTGSPLITTAAILHMCNFGTTRIIIFSVISGEFARAQKHFVGVKCAPTPGVWGSLDFSQKRIKDTKKDFNYRCHEDN